MARNVYIVLPMDFERYCPKCGKYWFTVILQRNFLAFAACCEDSCPYEAERLELEEKEVEGVGKCKLILRRLRR